MREILGQNQESGDQYTKLREQELSQLGEELSRKLTASLEERNAASSLDSSGDNTRDDMIDKARADVAAAFDSPANGGGRQLLVGEAYKAATSGGERATGVIRAERRRDIIIDGTGERFRKNESSSSDERNMSKLDKMFKRQAELEAKGTPVEMAMAEVMRAYSTSDNAIELASNQPVQPTEHAPDASVDYRQPAEVFSSKTVEDGNPIDQPEEEAIKLAADGAKAETNPVQAAESKSNLEQAHIVAAVRPVAEKIKETSVANDEERGGDAAPEELVASASKEGTDEKEIVGSPEAAAVETENTIQEAQKNTVSQEQSSAEFDQRSADREAHNFFRLYGSLLSPKARKDFIRRIGNNEFRITPDVIAEIRKVEQEFPRGSGVWKEAGRQKGSALQRAAYEAHSRLDSIVSIL